MEINIKYLLIGINLFLIVYSIILHYERRKRFKEFRKKENELFAKLIDKTIEINKRSNVSSVNIN